MYGLIVEYAGGPAVSPDQGGRWAYRDLLARQPGYRRRLELQADGYRRVLDLCLFASREAAEAALASEARRRFVAAHPRCADTAPALLVRDADAPGGKVVVLRGGQRPRRDHLDLAAVATELW